MKTEHQYSCGLCWTALIFRESMEHLGVGKHSGFQWVLLKEYVSRQKIYSYAP